MEARDRYRDRDSATASMARMYYMRQDAQMKLDWE